MGNHTLSGISVERDPIPVKQLKSKDVIGTLDLSNQGYGPKSAFLLARFLETFKPDVSSLILDRNPIVGGISSLAEMLTTNNQLIEIHLRFGGIKPDGARALADAMKVNKTLQKLVLIVNAIAVKGAKAIEEMLPYNKSLRYIDVRDNKISPEGKASLLEAAKMR